MRLAFLAVVVAALLLPAGASAADPRPRDPADGLTGPRLSEDEATRVFLSHSKVASWLERYPPEPSTDADFDRTSRVWTVKVWSGEAGEVARGEVEDGLGVVSEAWTGPQVAWKMARGYRGAFGGRTINSAPVWLGFAVVFFLGLADLRRPLSVRNLDLLVLLSFSISLWFFNRGQIFWSVPLVYPPLAYLAARLAWVGWRGRAAVEGYRPVWPVWVLAAAVVFLAGFRIGLSVRDANVIDVGYAGVIGAHRIATGELPYGNFPVARDRETCGPADSDGFVRERIQRNGRCEAANERGDTYGPVTYLAYVPGYALFGWTGRWDDLPAARFTAIAFDVLTVVGLALVGRRFGGARLAVTLAFAWTAYPFTQYAASSNSNDALVPAFLVFGFWLASSPAARGGLAALSGWTKFASLALAPLWLTYPDRRPSGRFLAGFAAATVAAFAVLLLEPSPVAAAQTFWDRTLGWQVGRESPFSLWGWGQYHAAGIPDLHLPQRVLQLLVVAGALAVAFVPRRKSPLQLAALTGAVLVGIHLALTHWFYLYIPWFFPFAAFALLAGTAARPASPPAEEAHERESRDLVPAG